MEKGTAIALGLGLAGAAALVMRGSRAEAPSCEKAYRNKNGTSSARDGTDCGRAGMASNPAFVWARTVEPGDTAGSTAELITGDPTRFVELLVANPDIATKGQTGVLPEGTMLRVPLSWNPFIDEIGNRNDPPRAFPTS